MPNSHAYKYWSLKLVIAEAGIQICAYRIINNIAKYMCYTLNF